MRKPMSLLGNLQTAHFWKKLEGFVKNPESLSLGRFYNDSLKNGDLVQVTV